MSSVTDYLEKTLTIELHYKHSNSENIQIRNEDVSWFILNHRFPCKYPLNVPEHLRQRPITVILPKEVQFEKDLYHGKFEMWIHPEYKKKGGRGLVYE